MGYKSRLGLLILLDSVIVTTAIFIASWVVYPYTSVVSMDAIVISAIALLVFHHVFAYIFKLYNKVWAYASVGELIAIVQAVTFSVIGAAIVQYIANDFSLYKRALLVTWMLHIIFIGGSRFIWRILRDRYIKDDRDHKRTLIVGAGAAGAMIARQLRDQSQEAELCPVAFVDDDLTKQKMQLYNIPVKGRVRDIPQIVGDMGIEYIVIAIPSLRNGQLKKIVDFCNQTNAKVQMIPKLEDLMTGKVTVSSLKNIEVEDLLGREPVELDIHAISKYVTDQTVMVTGAGGSIGSEICRQVMKFSPSKIILVGHGEFSIYSIDMELRGKYRDAGIEIIPVIGDVQDRDRMFEIMEMYKPRIVYHAAAHKHVPLMEQNPHEAVKNNIIGTKNVAEAADTFGIHTFVLVSTDKAVNPTNVMGATKRIAEMVIQDLSARSKTKFTAVRFGNVLGSRGSVIPLFRKQIADGGPVTVTDPKMTRYFMTIPEASRLVIQAGTLAKGGEIFVLDMGEPVKIVDLAKNLIKLSGYTEEEIPIEFTGIRPGEKMYEELLGEDEVHSDAVYEKIYVGKTSEVDQDVINGMIETFESYTRKDLKDALMEIVYMEHAYVTVKGS
ncbi:polysaccharide biosynthesis protein [Virgibacillus pantothenticus]|uniref:Polysaccharide biosynthesis protein EpsC n=1 Tax=Virgibacillus pantothenticus TaxID=1473 RepID=A0A0L0QKJ2_VIRPA|nr:nucleoside-diphosphate sugar epimerase/dehydratase [Virgibacillus pantothenticus]KNE18798.1 polysaccharide biosynthesis protein EpsC [Virgibacillus pantothenticus]MED3736763.1 nucleoside-diphosphate sugar epimerase/dehydratase [Virgibacillus pantothenticus]QTY15222.1 polysaccharide biosynthesis protein [Virgibacillus pantothenticus]SIT05609.1 NDP-sugar epimerase, includes UDP-GlcNAc-inverting 4,6-dehydratase FlaA1 and capsular polysaccharide biosynthesis protein EpsC [Virgibacillus pantothen